MIFVLPLCKEFTDKPKSSQNWSLLLYFMDVRVVRFTKDSYIQVKHNRPHFVRHKYVNKYEIYCIYMHNSVKNK